MTFNRYILFRMVVEFVGAIACAIQMFQHHTWPGIITMGVFALVWAIGEIWLSTVYNRAHPPPRRAVRRASGDGHPFHVLRACGGAGGVGLRRHDRHTVQACAVHRSRHGVADVGHAGAGHRRRRYLWLEHEAGTPMKTSLKFKRMERGLKQADLADLVNVRRETIGRLEQGQYCPSLRLAMDLAKALDTTVEDLFSFDDEE